MLRMFFLQQFSCLQAEGFFNKVQKKFLYGLLRNEGIFRGRTEGFTIFEWEILHARGYLNEESFTQNASSTDF